MAVLGTKAAGGGNDDNTTGVIVVTGSWTTDTFGGLVRSAWAFINSLGGAGARSQKVRLVIFPDDGSGNPTLVPVGVTDEISINDTMTLFQLIEFNSWQQFGGAPTLLPNTTYWLGMWWGPQVNSGLVFIDLTVAGGAQFNRFNVATAYSSTANPAPSAWSTDANKNDYTIGVDYAPIIPQPARSPGFRGPR